MKLITSNLVPFFFFFPPRLLSHRREWALRTGWAFIRMTVCILYRVNYSAPKPAGVLYKEPYNLKHLLLQNSLLFVCSPSRLVLLDYYVVRKGKSSIWRSQRGVHILLCENKPQYISPNQSLYLEGHDQHIPGFLLACVECSAGFVSK